MTLKYQLGSRQYTKYIFLPLIRFSAVIIIVTIGLLLWLDVPSYQITAVVGLIWSVVGSFHLFPLLIIGMRHIQLSKNAVLSIDDANYQCEYRQNDIATSFNLKEISNIIKVVSPPKYDERMDVLGFGYFFYWKFVFVDGRTLAISCMLLDVDNFFGVKHTFSKQLFPIPPSNRHLRATVNARKGSTL